jgi:hypothetical protein
MFARRKQYGEDSRCAEISTVVKQFDSVSDRCHDGCDVPCCVD